ncbi:MAG: MBOAT family protein [Ruminococcaceae bacterium]|nr:MBOAT family protein [Oscillospiraceae bacterium]
MEFSELWFLYLFLPLTILGYFLMPSVRSKNIFLLVASMAFYALAQPIYLLLFFAMTFVNYAFSLQVRAGDKKSLFVPIAITLGCLVLLKLVQIILPVTVSDASVAERFVLPLGISYYTFGLIAYQVDIYRGKHEPAKSLFDLLLYAFIFPKIITGPIVRYADFAPQIAKRRTDGKAVFQGLMRFVLGLSKKVLIADYCGNVITGLAKDTSGAGAWLCALMFMFQIYFEFSGCSDMAIGMARIFGFRFCENFNIPYGATSITDFWRRWHMSLSSFFRDYVYIPLGGNRKGKKRQILNMFVVWTLTGLWHGTSWNYVLWGVYFFVLLAVEKQIMPQLEKLNRYVRWAITSVLILFGWVIFAGQNFGRLFVFDSFWSTMVGVQLRNSLLLLVACVIGSSVLPRIVSTIWKNLFHDKSKELTTKQLVYVLSLFVLMGILLYLCTISLIGATNAPDIYGGKLR